MKCPKCGSNNTYIDDGMYACRTCGKRWPIVCKQVSFPPVNKTSKEEKNMPDQKTIAQDVSKDKLTALHNKLFEQLERLSDTKLDGEKLKDEIRRAQAVAGVAREMILNGKLALDVQVALKSRDIDCLPALLAIEHKK